ncbi:MAG: spore coat protein [Bacilli bacterium]|nr:spore coat protein [Bacilli bacterium]
MNDQILLDNYLLILKSTVEVYVHGTLESSNEEIRKILKESLNETLTHQANTYDEMTRYGWYQINNVESSKIKETLNKIKQK